MKLRIACKAADFIGRDKIEDLVFDEKSLMFLEKGKDDQRISYLLRLIKELPIKWRRAFILNVLENKLIK
ncbi:MAG: hypothetical protein PVG51_18705 [Desulfosarcina sp.]|jgi:hypothetical protein